MPWFFGCRCCRPYVTTRKLSLDLEVVWDGDWGPTVQPGPLKTSLYPNDSESLIRLTGIGVDSQGRCWNTGHAYVEDTIERVWQVTAKEFRADNGDLTNRSFDWNEDAQGSDTLGGQPLYDVSFNSQDEVAFVGEPQIDEQGGPRAYIHGVSIPGVNVTIQKADAIFRLGTGQQEGDIRSIEAHSLTDGFFYGQNNGLSCAAAFVGRNGFTGNWGHALTDQSGASLARDPVQILDVLSFPDAAFFLTEYKDSNGAGPTGNQIHSFDHEGDFTGVLYTPARPCTAMARHPEAEGIGTSFSQVRSDPGTGLQSVFQFAAGGSQKWAYDTGADTHDIAMDPDGNVYVVGERSDGLTLWKLDTDGNLLASFDHGADLRAVQYWRGFIYVCGDRAKDSEANH